MILRLLRVLFWLCILNYTLGLMTSNTNNILVFVPSVALVLFSIIKVTNALVLMVDKDFFLEPKKEGFISQVLKAAIGSILGILGIFLFQQNKPRIDKTVENIKKRFKKK